MEVVARLRETTIDPAVHLNFHRGSLTLPRSPRSVGTTNTFAGPSESIRKLIHMHSSQLYAPVLTVLILVLAVTLASGRLDVWTPLNSDNWGVTFQGETLSVVSVPANSHGFLLIALPGRKRVFRPARNPRTDLIGCWMGLSGHP